MNTNGANTTMDMRKCIADCLDCASACIETLPHCLSMGGRHAEPAHIRLLLDCAEMCRTAADFMLRGSDYHAGACALAAEVATACARSCAALDDDPRRTACAEACLRCASSAKAMASPVAGPRYDKTVADTFPASDPPATPVRA